MDRFIVHNHIPDAVKDNYLKSSMDRFIVLYLSYKIPPMLI